MSIANIEDYNEVTQAAVIETAQDFHIEATTEHGVALSVPCSYQILEPGFRPFKAGKATAEELQTEFEAAVQKAEAGNIRIGIEGEESVRKILIQLGLGIDCSNLEYRGLSLIHSRLDLPAYTNTVYRDAEDVRELHDSKESWTAKDQYGAPRNMTGEEKEKLADSDKLEVSWIADIFGKDPEFIIGAHHIAEASVPVDPINLSPGDILAFGKAGNGVVSHVAMVETIDQLDESLDVAFWHSWHTRGFNAGLRRDNVRINTNINQLTWSHEGLADTSRYAGHFFCRPIGMHALAASLKQ